MKEQLEGYIKEALAELGISDASFTLEHPADMAHGDWATNAAMVAFAGARQKEVKEMQGLPVRPKKSKQVLLHEVFNEYEWSNPRELAGNIKKIIEFKKDPDIIAIDIAGPGFINFKLASAVFDKELTTVISQGERWGWNETLKGKKVMVEYTDPNPFKEFHIGHLMSNTIGESISRLIEASGAETKRACYQGDVGLHVAKAVWGIMKGDELMMKLYRETKDVPLHKKLTFLAIAYAQGARAYETGYPENQNLERCRSEITAINKKIYDRSDSKINELYDWGKIASLEYFETIYKRLGTQHEGGKAFNYYFFESKTGEFGKKIVEEHPEIFEKSDGAIVYKGDEAKGLHTRVFINKDGLPTYEAKELGLAKIKYDSFPYDTSIVITGNEVNDYFKVLLDAMQKVFPELAEKTEHYSHGMLRLPTGKMSSRTGDVITAVSLIGEAKEKAQEKINPNIVQADQRDALAEQVAIGAIKYSILRQSKGRDIIFDFDQSLSFEGDSGPYLQYTCARAHSVSRRAEDAPMSVDCPHKDYGSLPKLLVRFPEVVLRASEEREPHHVANYLIEVAREFNSFYGNTTILDGTSDQSYKLALTKAVGMTLKNGLWLLGTVAPDKM